MLEQTNPLASSRLTDGYGRVLRYLRLAVTAHCNLHCLYCRPRGKPLSTAPDMPGDRLIRLVDIMGNLGVEKIRITGGEPLVRQDILPILSEMTALRPDCRFHLPTNGVLLKNCARRLADIGISGINVSLDAGDTGAYQFITGSNNLSAVLAGIRAAIGWGIPTKINCVVLEKNENHLRKLTEMAEKWPVSVRFIEAMPFNGCSSTDKRIPLKPVAEDIIQETGAIPIADQTGTATLYQIPGAPGTIGFIYAYSRTFCSSCNRLRITPEGQLQLCLYQQPIMDLKRLLEEEKDNERIAEFIRTAALKKPKDGRTAQENQQPACYPSMASIGG